MQAIGETKHPEYKENVFINCPFDQKYDRMFLAIVFTIISLKLRPKSARVRTASEIRIKKICGLIRDSKYGVHDISRTQLDKKSGLPRFNMPFELGLDLGCKEFNDSYSDKTMLVVESRNYESQKFLSDILGYDPDAHGNNAERLIKIVSDWLRNELENPELPNGKQIFENFKLFEIDYREAKKNLLPKRPAFIDLTYSIAKWIDKMRKGT